MNHDIGNPLFREPSDAFAHGFAVRSDVSPPLTKAKIGTALKLGAHNQPSEISNYRLCPALV